jgi:Protein of unknown function (DUF983)
MVPACPQCDLRFEREDGYWVGAVIMNTAVTEAVFGAILVAVLLSTAPDVPWVPLVAAGLATNGILPVLFYPFSKTLWMAVDVHFHPLGED